MPHVTLKRAVGDELKEVAEIENQARSKTYAAAESLEELKGLVKKAVVFFLIKQGNVTIGNIAYEELNKNRVRLRHLALYSKYRGKGLAEKAIKTILKKLQKYKVTELTVHPHNNRAIRLYLSLDFKIESWKDNYFGDGEPRLVLVHRASK
jgi:ribosomal protein S18 acetylase RimI-like enzyme